MAAGGQGPRFSVLIGILFAVWFIATPAAAADLPALLDSLATYHHVSRPDRVDSLATPAIATARADHDSLALGALLLARGRTRAAFGLARKAEPDLREALILAETTGDTIAYLRGLRWLSVAVGRQGRGAEALHLYRDLEALATVADDSLHLSWAWVGRAYAHYLGGQADSAGALYAEAAGVLARAGEMRGAIWARNGEGLARRQGGDFAGAGAGFRAALQMSRATGDALNEAVALNYLGRLELSFGDPSRAEAMFAQAAAIHRAHQHHREGLLPRIDMARARSLAGRPGAAATLLDSVLVEAQENGLADLEFLATNQLVDVLLDLDRPGAAAAACRRLLQRPELPSAMAATEVRLRLARALAARDSVDAAIAVLDNIDTTGPGARSLELHAAALRGRLLLTQERSVEVVAELRPIIGADPTRGGDALRIPVLTALGRAWLGVEEPDSALAAFDEAVALWDAARSMPEDPVWRERRSVDAGDLFAYAVAAHLVEPGAAPLAVRQANAYELLQRYKARTLFERMLGPGHELPELETPTSLVSLRRDALRPGDVVLDVVQGADLGVLFCVTCDTVLTAGLPGAREAASSLRRLETALSSPAVTDPEPAVRLAADLLAVLPDPVRERLQAARRIYWCPDGSLHRLPLALLAGADGWLTVGCEVVRLPAATMLRRLQTDAAQTGTDILALYGSEPGSTVPLPGALAETRWLAARLQNVRRYQGFEALAADGVDWRRASVLHLATHVDLDRRQPWQTAVRLGPGPAGRLHASEVAMFPIDAGLVVLSGCRTAGSGVVGGEGLLGLGAGFLAAGVPVVLATLWDVDDHVTARFVADFYGELADGNTTAGALAVAREACRGRVETAAPRHWAGFVLVGDGGRRVPVQRRRALWPVGIVLLGGAILAIWRGRRGFPV